MYVVQVFTAQEKKVKKALEEYIESSGMADLIEEVLLPTENVMEVKKGEQKISEREFGLAMCLLKCRSQMSLGSMSRGQQG